MPVAIVSLLTNNACTQILTLCNLCSNISSLKPSPPKKWLHITEARIYKKEKNSRIKFFSWLTRRGLSLLHETTGQIHSRNICVWVRGGLRNELRENNTFLYLTAKCSEILWEETTWCKRTYRGTVSNLWVTHWVSIKIWHISVLKKIICFRF